MKKGRQKKPIKYRIERIVLSDVLPFETPVIFSNRHFYDFLVKYKIKFDAKNKIPKITWHKCQYDGTLQMITKVLFDGQSSPFSLNEIKFGTSASPNKYSKKIPFGYKIIRKENSFRDLVVPHPKNQIELIAFYEEFKELIMYYSKLSPFSIRKPNSVARFVYSNDNISKSNQGDENDLIEEAGKEYKNLKNFFTYKKFSNIYKFYEHYDYHRAEKKYAKMFKFDISRCFDSIYTHSLAWALYSKEYSKQHLSVYKYKTFADKFDVFMQNANYGETNGIIIGPEFSRIFAELILQSIDKKAVQKLLLDKNIKNRVDYQIYRYVDDFFVFYNEDKTKDDILVTFSLLLKEYKMGLNESKTIHFKKPLITDITIAKNKIVNLFNQEVKFKIKPEEERDNKILTESKKIIGDSVVEKKIQVSDVKISCDANKLITEFKTIISTTGVSYMDVMNYTIVVMHNKFERDLKRYKKHKKELDNKKYKEELSNEEKTTISKQERNFTNYVVELLDCIFFLYNVSPRVNTTVKLVKTLALIIEEYSNKYKIIKVENYDLEPQFSIINKELVFKKIFDEITLVLDKSKIEKHIQVETLYLLITLRELGKEYRLTTEQLLKYLKLNELKDDEENSFCPKMYAFKNDINYFVITVLLFYFKDIQQYKELQESVKTAVINKIENIRESDRSKHSELVLLLFDLLACPFLKEPENKFKKELLQYFGINEIEMDAFITFVEKQKYWFTKWDNFSLIDELNAKSSLEPYS